MKSVVVYKSKTGFVKKYAEWIAEELSADIFEASKVSLAKLIDYDTIIYGGGLYVSGINGIKLITENMSKLKKSNIIVYASGASPYREDILGELLNHNFTNDQQARIKLFYLRGGFNYSKLSLFYKIVMSLLKLKLKIKSTPTSDEKGMLAAYGKPMDFTKQKNIADLISYVNALPPM